jgi:hypothetical protein
MLTPIIYLVFEIVIDQAIFVVLFVDHNRSTIGLLRPTILEGTLLKVALHLIEVYFIMNHFI